MVNYSRVEEPCFVCEAEDSLNESRGTQSHPINCGWRLKEEHKVMEESLEKDRKFLFWSESENRPKVMQVTKYDDETLRVLTAISEWTLEGNRPDISGEEKLKIIREELAKILP